jgi:hypothetical protein
MERKIRCRLPDDCLRPFYRNGQLVVPRDHDGNGLFTADFDELPDLIYKFQLLTVYSDQTCWFRIPAGLSQVGLTEPDFTFFAGKDGCFEAPVSCAPLLMCLAGCTWLGRRPGEKPRRGQGPTQGRPLKFKWADFDAELLRQLEHHGPPSIDDPDWRNKAAIVRAMQTWCVATWGEEPGFTTIRDRVNEILKDFLAR